MTRQIVKQVGIRNEDEYELDELENDIAPEQVLDTLEQQANWERSD